MYTECSCARIFFLESTQLVENRNELREYRAAGQRVGSVFGGRSMRTIGEKGSQGRRGE